MSRVLALLDHPKAAARFGRRALRIAEENDLGPFYAGYAHEALARAASISGDTATRDAHLDRARALANDVERQGEADVLKKDLDQLTA